MNWTIVHGVEFPRIRCAFFIAGLPFIQEVCMLNGFSCDQLFATLYIVAQGCGFNTLPRDEPTSPVADSLPLSHQGRPLSKMLWHKGTPRVEFWRWLFRLLRIPKLCELTIHSCNHVPTHHIWYKKSPNQHGLSVMAQPWFVGCSTDLVAKKKKKNPASDLKMPTVC